MNYRLEPDIPADTLIQYQKAGLVAVDTELHGLSLQRDQVCLVQICDGGQNLSLIHTPHTTCPPRLKSLLEDAQILKIFHYAIVDVAFIRKTFQISVNSYHCTKVMSKLYRTYTDAHGLKDLVHACTGHVLNKAMQTSDWSSEALTAEQLAYAAEDVIYLIPVYEKLSADLKTRQALPSGISMVDLNEMCQNQLPVLVELALNGYTARSGIADQWNTEVFLH